MVSLKETIEILTRRPRRASAHKRSNATKLGSPDRELPAGEFNRA
jgi:hypothetical protein